MCQMKDVNRQCVSGVDRAGAVRLRGARKQSETFRPAGAGKKRWLKVVKKVVGFWLSVGVRVRTRHGRKENHVLFLDNVRITRAFSFLVFHPGLPKITQDLWSSETCKSAHGFHLYKEVKERLVPGCAF